MIFCLPGLLLMNAAIIKHTASCASLSQMVRTPHQATMHAALQTTSQPVRHTANTGCAQLLRHALAGASMQRAAFACLAHLCAIGGGLQL